MISPQLYSPVVIIHPPYQNLHCCLTLPCVQKDLRTRLMNIIRLHDVFWTQASKPKVVPSVPFSSFYIPSVCRPDNEPKASQ